MRLVKHLYRFLINSWCIVTSLLQVAMCGSDLLFKQYNYFSKFFSVCLLFPMNECYPDTKLKKPQQPNRPKTVAMVPTGGHIPPVGDLCYKVSSSCFLYITDFCIVFLVWKKTRKSQAGGHWTVTELYSSPSPLVVVKLCDTQLWLSRATCWETKPFQWITTMN